MSTFTENYNLIKPSSEDYYDVADFNENMDVIDAQLALREQENGSISEKIGNPEDVGDTTVFGLLKNNNGSIIKSIQRVFLSCDCYIGSDSKGINPVVPEKCILLIERMGDDSKGASVVTYTLEADTLSVAARSNISGNIHLLFQIIELY